MIRRIAFFLLLLVSVQVFSQRSSSSPYSIFGAGEEFGTRTVEQISMGSIGAAYRSNRNLNFLNPASLSGLRYATYAFGIQNNGLRIKDATTDQSTTSTSLSYFSLAFPVSPKMSMVFGMQPTSAVGYSLTNTLEDSEGNAIDITEFSGTGSVNRIYGGFGVELFKSFSIGFEADFLFGNIENNIINARQNVALATKNEEKSNVRGASVKVGVQYEKQLKKDINLTAGASFKLSNTLRFTGNQHLYSLSFGSSGNEIPRNTLFNGDLKGNLKRPLETIIGIGLGKTDKWFAAVDYKFQSALNSDGFLNNSSETFRYGNSNRISLGGFYIPKIFSLSSYFQRITYRLGVKYEKTGLLVNGITNGTTFTGINDFGMSFGLGLPIGGSLPSNLNFAVEYGKRGTTNNGLLQENYVNVRLSLSLNDIWFKKRRID